MKYVFSASFLFLIALFSTTSAFSQEARPSPADSTTGKINNATIEIKYSSPAVKGRKIWGDLVPYGQVWRAGANEATTFQTDKDLTVEGKRLPAGKYAFFLLPAENGDWTAIFNKTANQWGAFKYDEKQDALRVKVKPVKSASMNERLKYDVTKNGIVMRWENWNVPVSIK